MKTLITCIVALLLVSCARDTITAQSLEKAIELCKANDGLYYVETSTIATFNVYCMNGAKFNIAHVRTDNGRGAQQ